MAEIINISKNDEKKLINILQKAVQSCNLNFLIGAGCSVPAIDSLGDIEQEVQKSDAKKKLFNFISNFMNPTNFLKNYDLNLKCKTKEEKKNDTTLKNYIHFLQGISRLLFERKNKLLHKQATIFSTNYDMFIEKTSELLPDTIILNDGFARNPSLKKDYVFSPTSFFNIVLNTGNLYKYQVEIPSINLIKLHGSLNWQLRNEKIYQSLEHLKDTKKENFLENLAIILPRKDKFKETVLKQVYYDLLRIYANELDKENTLLIAEGFSFEDEHIFEITKRALKNPTLRLIIFCYNKNDSNANKEKFSDFNNVEIISSSNNLDFKKFIAIMNKILPEKKENKENGQD